MKQQILFVHGGETFDSNESYLNALRSWEVDPFEEKGQKWKDSLAEELGEKHEVFFPAMPTKQNAKYEAWKIWFEKYIPFLCDDVILLGYSLGGIFLTKYLAENDLPVKVRDLLLLAAPFWTAGDHGGEEVADFLLPEDLGNIAKQAKHIALFQSENDTIVPPENAQKYKKHLPEAELKTFANYGHFLIPEFPELIEYIKHIDAE